MRTQYNPFQKRNQRNGMALLFVISLILFITLLGTSFVVVSQQFSKSAKNRTRVDATGDSSRQLVQRAFRDLVRGPESDNLQSVLRGGHSLLEDMYGYGFSAIVEDVAEVNFTAPQDPGPPVEYDLPGAIEITLNDSDGATAGIQVEANLRPVSPGEVAPAVETLSDIPGYYNGRVLTFVGGALTGTSVRVVAYSGLNNGYYTGQPYTFTVYREQSRDEPANLTDLVGTSVVMNGRAYSGWGAGGIVGNNLGVAALAPNRVTNPGLNAYNISGPNESYDAPDYQNLFLSAIDDTAGAPDIMAAFEREQLFDAVGADANFRAFGDPGDDLNVDNDGDGVLDSIWIDPGYTIQTDVDGRRYKPLVAYLVLDMDGRFNVNAHDNLFNFDRDSNNVLDRAVVNSGVNLLGSVDPTIYHPTAPAGLPKGQYLGPAEISMVPDLFNIGDTDHLDLILSRYGADDHPGNVNLRDAWSQYKQFGHPDANNPDNIYPNQFTGGLFGTLLDFHGRYGRSIPDAYWGTTSVPYGLPVADGDTGLGNPLNEIRNSQYEMAIFPSSRYAINSADRSDDDPFSAKEMERILRQYDRDSGMLPSRLADFYGNRNRNLIGHASFETPAIPGFPGGAQPIHIVERLHNVLVAQGGILPANTGPIIEELLSFELRMGLPFDINRPFGDGRDNDGDGTYDEFDELLLANEVLDTVDGGSVNMNLDQYSRQNFAKQLYALTLLVTGDQALGGDTAVLTPPSPAQLNQPFTNEDWIRRFAIAQWVVNVVDFRDSDSICTPFEFDLNPFNGWSPEADGDLLGPADPLGETFVVWGCERPELLLTESVAFHDRRSEDLTVAGGGDTSSGDNDYDSRLVPNASAFFELYRPWTQNDANQLNPREMEASNTESGINLVQQSVAGNPVWRMVVTTEANFSTTYRDVSPRAGIEAIDEAEEYRRIYFVEPNTTVEPVGNRHKVYWPDATVQGQLSGNSFIQPGQYAVIGSAGKYDGSAAYETWFGRRTEPNWDTLLAQTRGISLLPSSQQIEIRSGSPPVTSTVDAIAIPINATVSNATGAQIERSLGISDPVNGYFDYDTLADVFAVEDGFEYTSTKDQPVDQDPAIQTDNFVLQSLRVNGVRTNFRSVFLQRLADPTQAWDAVSNPYLTIDRQMLDLTAFNGMGDDASDPLIANGTVQLFASNERGRFRNPALTSGVTAPVNQRRQLWPIEPPTEDGSVINASAADPSRPGPYTDTHHYLNEFEGSLGDVNDSYDHPDFVVNGQAPVGFAGLTWNNRPFANRMELLDVPFTTSHELLANPLAIGNSGPSGLPAVGYTLDKVATSASVTDPYSAPVRGGQFGHLFNFFAPGDTLDSDPQNLMALLDFVRVPSRFAGTQIHINGSQTSLPPFNTLSRYREPGKMNINTMLNQSVIDGWGGQIGRAFSVNGLDSNGMAISYANAGVSSVDFEGARRSNAGGTVRFDNPYRSTFAFDKTPAGLDMTNPVEASLLRNHVGVNMDPVLETDGTLPWADPSRESTYRFETLRRIGATTTERSSVFAIWLTVGFFEVDEDGNLLTSNATGVETGVELGASSGNSKRSRGFYIFDRSIPVACEAGVDHNIERGILVESIID